MLYRQAKQEALTEHCKNRLKLTNLKLTHRSSEFASKLIIGHLKRIKGNEDLKEKTRKLLRKLQILLNAGEKKESDALFSSFLRLESILDIEKSIKKLRDPISPRSRNQTLLPL